MRIIPPAFKSQNAAALPRKDASVSIIAKKMAGWWMFYGLDCSIPNGRIDIPIIKIVQVSRFGLAR